VASCTLVGNLEGGNRSASSRGGESQVRYLGREKCPRTSEEEGQDLMIRYQFDWKRKEVGLGGRREKKKRGILSTKKKGRGASSLALQGGEKEGHSKPAALLRKNGEEFYQREKGSTLYGQGEMTQPIFMSKKNGPRNSGTKKWSSSPPLRGGKKKEETFRRS